MHTLRLLWFVPPPIASIAAAWKLLADIALHAERNPSSDEQFEALASGRADAVVTAMDNVMEWNLRPGPQDLRIVAQLESTTPLSLVGQPGQTKPEDLRGAKLLVDAPRNGFVVALRAMLAESGVGPEAYALEQVGGVKERFDALVAGRGDATLLGPPFDALALQTGFSRIASVQERYPAFPGQGLVVRASEIDRLRPALSAWLLILDKVLKRTNESPSAAREALVQEGLSVQAADSMVKMAPTTLCPNRSGVELLIRQRRQIALLGADTSYEQLVDLSLLPGPGDGFAEPGFSICST